MKLTVECEQEEDGRWLVEVHEMPGVLTYGYTPREAKIRAETLARHVLADRFEHGEIKPDSR